MKVEKTWEWGGGGERGGDGGTELTRINFIHVYGGDGIRDNRWQKDVGLTDTFFLGETRGGPLYTCH